jgi:hypothetical protein
MIRATAAATNRDNERRVNPSPQVKRGMGFVLQKGGVEQMTVQNGSPVLRLRDGLRQHFGPGAAVFVYPFLWLIGCVCVDIVRLDNWLMQRNPDYLENESMRLSIRRKHGRRAERFVAYWLRGEGREGRETGDSKGGKATDIAGVEEKRQP